MGVHPIPLFATIPGDAEIGRYLVIRIDGGTRGLMALFVLAAGWIDYAEREGYIPVVDLKTLRNMYHKDEEVGKLNVWDLFFEQPGGCKLEEIPRGAEVTVVTPSGDEANIYPWDILDMQGEELLHWQTLAKKTLKLLKSVNEQYAVEAFEKAVKGDVLGVHIRGTDYAGAKPPGHTIQPTVEQVIEKIEWFDRQHGNKMPIYLTTEDLQIERRMLEKFGERMILPIQEREEYHGGFLAESDFLKGNHRAGAMYAKLIFDFSRCKCVIGGRCNGTAAAMLLGGGGSIAFSLIWANIQAV